ncbi:MAG: hypothetical protein KDD40_03190 [Bdellovibrionales bacterium]|nr:hypothetical protein [Bdellovibrionales bacterium]
MFKKLFISCSLLLATTVSAFADETGVIEIDMESRRYDPGEGIPLGFSGPIKVEKIRVLTSGQRNATLTAYVDGNIAKTSYGSYSYTYDYNWSPEWVTFEMPYARRGQRIHLRFGQTDPRIHKLEIHYKTHVKTRVEVKWRTRTVYVPKSQMADKLAEIQNGFYELKEEFARSSGYREFFKKGHQLLFRAKVRANTHNASDPDRRVGEAVDKFLEEFACTGVLDVYGEMAYRNLGVVGSEIEKLATSIFQLADIRRYDPAQCGPFMSNWLSKYEDNL